MRNEQELLLNAMHKISVDEKLNFLELLINKEDKKAFSYLVDCLINLSIQELEEGENEQYFNDLMS